MAEMHALMDGVRGIWFGHCLEVIETSNNRLVVPRVLPVCPILIGMEYLGGFCRGIMGLHSFGCRTHSKHLQTVVNHFLLLEFDSTVWVLGEPSPQVVLEVTFIGEFKRLVEGHDLMVDCHGVGGKEGSSINVEDKKDSALDKEAGVNFGLSEAS